MTMGQFRGTEGSMAVKEFGSDFCETLDLNDLDRVPEEVINANGGESFTQGLKRKCGKSKTDFYGDKDGNIYAVPKTGGVPQLVGQLQR